MDNNITNEQKNLLGHPIYKNLTSVKNIQIFMEYHVFAVWDFMSLLKSLQREITCVSIPWMPSKYPNEMVRLINQIVLGEESDIDHEGNPCSHFELYVKAMNEIGVETYALNNFLESFDYRHIPLGAREFVCKNVELSQSGDVVNIAAAFFFGREKLIPEMFNQIVTVLNDAKINAPTFIYYLKRHIEVDSEEHGPLALRCLDILCEGKDDLKEKAYLQGVDSLRSRYRLWDHALLKMQENK